MFGPQVLVNAFGAEAASQHGEDDSPPQRARAGPASGRSALWVGDRLDAATVQGTGRAGGRNGWFCLIGLLVKIARDHLAVDAQFAGDTSLRPAAII